MNFANISYLVVEDDSFQRWMLEQQLWQLNAAHVSSASDGRMALEALRDGHFDVIVSDLDMPGMDGMEFLRRLSELPGAPLVILSTGQGGAIISSVENMAEAYGIRLLGSVEKPPTRAKLSAVLGNYAALREARDASIAPQEGLADLLPEALENGEITPWFQPKIEISTNRIVGAEALARWVRPDGSMLLPDRFLGDAERLRLLPLLTETIVARSFEACAQWHRNGISAEVSLNMSPTVLGGGDVADALSTAVASYGVKPSDVTIELTESAAAKDLGPVLETLTRLRMRGFGLSIDDFGTGYATMQQLTRIPFSELKIDQSFVKAGSIRPASRAVIESSIAMASKLGLRTVAEGVETQAEWQLVRDLGCDLAQGWLLGKAMPLERFIALARERR
jgi:EAL domain-containing protein (putative c-di-GMP-specific phosphodiesterase class I)/FixJ family two-component response regulator